MALFPRLTRPAVRIIIESLTAYIPALDAAAQEIATDTIRQMQYLIDSANADKRRRRNQSESLPTVDTEKKGDK